MAGWVNGIKVQEIIYFTTVKRQWNEKKNKKSAELMSYKATFENTDSFMKVGKIFWTLLKMYIDTGSGARCCCASDISRVPVLVGNKWNSYWGDSAGFSVMFVWNAICNLRK